VISATFWTWLWGPIGLLLSTPLAVCLGVLGRHIESLEFLEIMIGDEPPLTPAQSFYERALSGSEDEAIDLMEECLKKGKDITDCYQRIVIEGLRLAESDRLRGVLDDEHADRIDNVVRSLLAELAERQDLLREPSQEEQTAAPPPAPAASEYPVVLCVSGPGRFDPAIALVLAQVLADAGFRTRIKTEAAIKPLKIPQLETDGVAVVCLSCLHLGDNTAHLRYSTKRLRRRLPSATIVACLWGNAENNIPRSELMTAGIQHCAFTLAEAVALCRKAVFASDRVMPPDQRPAHCPDAVRRLSSHGAQPHRNAGTRAG
jgi:hypothetical protein